MSIQRFDIKPYLEYLQSGSLLLTPNHRSAKFIIQSYSDHQDSQSAWLRPQVFAVDIWLQQLWQTAAANSIEPFSDIELLDRYNEHCVWANILQSSVDDFPLLNIDEAAASVARSYQLYTQWDVGSSSEPGKYGQAQDFQAFLFWSQRFKKACKEQAIVGLSEGTALLIENLSSLTSLLPAEILLVGFTQPPPLYQTLFQSLGEISKLNHAHDSVESVNTSQFPNAGHCPIKRYEFASAKLEIEACVDWALALNGEDPQQHIGIVLDSGRNLEAGIEEYFRKHHNSGDAEESALPSLLPYNKISSNESLAQCQLVYSALAIIELNSERVDTEKFARLIQSSHLVGAADEMSARLALDKQLRKKLEARSRLASIRDLMSVESRDYHCPLLAEKLAEFSEQKRRLGNSAKASQWAELFRRQLELLEWPGTSISASQLDQFQQWQQCLNQFAASSRTLGSLNYSGAIGKLKLLLGQSSRKQPFRQDIGISLVTVDEALDLSFSQLWILSASDQAWPASPSPAAFIPYTIQSELGMPACSADMQLAQAYSQLNALHSQSSGELIISHHRLADELKLRPSSLSRSLPLSTWHSSATQEADLLAAKPQRSKVIERVKESLHIPLAADEAVSGGSKLLSNQSNCPFKAFASHRLKAEKPWDFTLGLTPIARGDALHYALELLSQKLPTSESINAASLSDIDEHIAASTEPVIARLRQQFPETMTPAFAELESTRLRLLLHAFLDHERERSSFSIQGREIEEQWQHSKLLLNIRIDRVDVLQDGSLALMDYKTGKHANYRWFDERPDDLQLPLYQIAISEAQQKTVSAALIYQVNAENIRLLGATDLSDFHPDLKTVAKNSRYEGDWPQLRERWNKIIHIMVAEFESGLLAVAPTRGRDTCKYCDIAPLCRIDEVDEAALEAALETSLETKGEESW